MTVIMRAVKTVPEHLPQDSIEPPNECLPRAPLRIALLLDNWQVPRWVEDIISSLSGSSHMQLVLVVLADHPPAPKHSQRWQWAWQNRHLLAFKVYQKLDDGLFGRKNDPFAPRDIQRLLGDVPCLRVEPILDKHSDCLSERDLLEIAHYRLDVALRFGFRILGGGVLKMARYGVWSFHNGDNRENRGGPPATWEVFEQNPVTGTVLQILTEDLNAGHVIARVNMASDRRSVRRNRNILYEKAWPMMPRLLEQLYANGRVDLEPSPIAYDRRSYQTPNNFETLRGVAKIVKRWVADKVVGSIWHEQWQLGYYLGEGSLTPSRLKPIEPPRDRFWADPFPVEADGGYVVFFEECIYTRRVEEWKGRISAIRIDAEGTLGPVSKVLEESYHLSYPFVYFWRGDWYMLPESGDAKRLLLYKCKRFPESWEPCAELLAGVAGRDNTLAEIDGRWWLWVSLRQRGARHTDETLLFYADTPLGPFTPHVRNPVVADARFARGAGRPFLHDGAWIRPAQDGTGRYGRAVVFRRIDRISVREYAESEAGRLEPFWDPSIVATHTYNRAGRLHVIDFVKRRATWR